MIATKNSQYNSFISNTLVLQLWNCKNHPELWKIKPRLNLNQPPIFQAGMIQIIPSRWLRVSDPWFCLFQPLPQFDGCLLFRGGVWVCVWRSMLSLIQTIVWFSSSQLTTDEARQRHVCLESTLERVCPLLTIECNYAQPYFHPAKEGETLHNHSGNRKLLNPAF